MTFRLTGKTALQGVMQQMLAMSAYVRESGLDHNLLELMSMRASQINGCAHCLALHTRTLREAGEREDRIAVLPAWRETGWFTDRERAALAWAEAVTTLAGREVPEDVFAQARAEFSERELVDLTWAVIATNAANRVSIAFHYPPTPFTIDAREAVAAGS
jgi:AhpD family alkylhydroperoxidase